MFACNARNTCTSCAAATRVSNRQPKVIVKVLAQGGIASVEENLRITRAPNASTKVYGIRG
jgi:hypothetical protein